MAKGWSRWWKQEQKRSPIEKPLGRWKRDTEGGFVGEERWVSCRTDPDRDKDAQGGDKPEPQEDGCG